MPRRRREPESSSESESSSSDDGGPPQEPWLVNQQKRGGYTVLKSGLHRYDEWCGLNKYGEMVTYPGNGALFPEGYQPNWQQSKPFRCPMMNCRTAWEHAHQMGAHFRTAHRKALLFDQRNGSFSLYGRKKVPTDKEFRHGRRKWAPIVVKRAPQSGWQAVAQPQQLQAQQAAPAPAVQPVAPDADAGPAPLPAAPQPDAAPPPAAQVGPFPRRNRPPLAVRRGARQASAPAMGQQFPQLPLPGTPVRGAASSPFRRPQPLPPLPPRPPQPPIPLPPIREAPPTQPTPASVVSDRQVLAQRSAALQTSEIWTYLGYLLPRPTPAFPVPKDSAVQTFLTLPRCRALPTCWRNKVKQHFSPGQPPLALKELTSMVWYLAAPKTGTHTPCGTERCPVHTLVNSFRELGRDANGKRQWSDISRFEEILLEFNDPGPECGSVRGPRREMGFPRCVAFENGGLERLEENARERERRGEIAWGGDWEAVKERLGGYTCANAYWCRAEEMPWPE